LNHGSVLGQRKISWLLFPDHDV